MKLCNDVITVFTARVDPELGDDVWAPTVIKDVSWYATDASTVDASKGGLVAANKVTVRIPANVFPEGLELKNGDVIVKADASGVADPTPAKLKKAYGGDFMTVLAVTDNRRAPRAPHVKVIGT